MPGEPKRTKDHEVIRHWVEERGGKPAVVKNTKGNGDGIGVLRIDFPGFSGENTLEHISWEDFFKTFDEKGLEFLYQDELESGKQSRFFKFVNPE